MLGTLKETVELIESQVPCSLVSPQIVSSVERITTLFPTAVSSCYWECRLGADMPQVDFLTCITVADGGREALVRGLSPLLVQVPLWKQAQRFFQQWAKPRTLLYEHSPLIWFEFDQVNSSLSDVPSPSFSFCIDSLYAERRTWEQYTNARDLQRCRQVAEEGLQLLFGASLAQESREALAACFGALPKDGRIIHLSAMVARQPAVIKVYGSVPRTQLFPFLTKIGWPGPFSELNDILTAYCTSETVDHNMFIDISIEGTVLSKLGIAFAQQQIDNLPLRDPARTQLLELCVQTELCTPEKRDALLTWPGTFRAVFDGEQRSTRVHKWLDVKFIYQPGQPDPLEAKAYLGFMPQISLF